MLKVVHSSWKLLPLLAGVFSLAFVFSANQGATAANLTPSVTVNSSLTVTIPSTPINLNLNPYSNNFGYGDVTITVGTNNPAGYKTIMTSADGTTNLTDSEDAEKVIPTLTTSGLTESTFEVNHWGYKKDSGNYQPFTTDTVILESDTYANDDTATLRFATKIDYMQPEGDYSTVLSFTTTATPVVQYIQNLDPTLCTTDPMQVIDARDNQEYYVQRLADGNCWMMDNLNLGAIDLTQDLTSDNTNCATSGSTACVATNMSGTPSLTADNFNSYEKTSGSGTYTAPEYIPVSGNDTTMGEPGVPYGTLYNYCAASAGTICNDSNSSNASYDLCPAGWRLPTGGSSGEFQSLYGLSAYNTNAKMRASYTSGGAAFALAGNFYAGTPTYQGSSGIFWSSSRFDNTGMCTLYLDTSEVYPANSRYRAIGLSIRCVLKPQSMQSFTTDDADAMAAGSTTILKDERDGKTYKVAKLADGNVWMTENLNLAGGTALSADDTDVTSEYISGFTTQGNLTKNANNTISLPSSTTNGFNNNSNAYVYNTNRTNCSSPGCYGYYSWIAATLGGKQADGSTAEQRDGYNAAASICPKGWKLPSSTTSNAPAQTSPNWKTGDFYKLAKAYGVNLEGNYYESAATFYNNAGPGKVPNFLLAGYYNSGSFNDGGSYGYYWSSSSTSSTLAYGLDFRSSYVYSADRYNRYSGFAVRCIFNPGS